MINLKNLSKEKIYGGSDVDPSPYGVSVISNSIKIEDVLPITAKRHKIVTTWEPLGTQ